MYPLTFQITASDGPFDPLARCPPVMHHKSVADVVWSKYERTDAAQELTGAETEYSSRIHH